MRRLLAFALFAFAALSLQAADPTDDKAKLQGVWHSPPDAKVPARVIVIGDKVGYAIGDPTAKTPAPGSSFVAVSDAKFAEKGGKKSIELTLGKDYTKVIDYRFEKYGLVVNVNDKEYPLRRVSTRADDPAAKKFAGKWTVTAMEVKGMKQRGAGGKDVGSVAFTGDRYVWTGPDGKEFLNSLYRLGEAKDGRAELDIYGLKPDPVIPMLVELKGDELTVSMPAKPGDKATRPTGFDTKAADILVMHATRAK